MRKFISGLILGAGASSRLGRPKQLLPYRNTTLLGWVTRQAQYAAALDEVIVVLGRAADEIRNQTDFGNAKVVENAAFTEGCASSYRAGIGALDPRSEALMILLGDQPGISPYIIDRMAEEWRERDSEVMLASYRGRKGHPMIFAKSMFDKLIALHGDKAAWKLVDANLKTLREVAFDLPFPQDIDTQEDYERAQQDARKK
jgi:molybdenum cofactor cytidylyltransferase